MWYCRHLSFRSNMCISERDLYTYVGYLLVCFSFLPSQKRTETPYACRSSEARFVEFKQGQFCTRARNTNDIRIQTSRPYVTVAKIRFDFDAFGRASVSETSRLF